MPNVNSRGVPRAYVNSNQSMTTENAKTFGKWLCWFLIFVGAVTAAVLAGLAYHAACQAAEVGEINQDLIEGLASIDFDALGPATEVHDTLNTRVDSVATRTATLERLYQSIGESLNELLARPIRDNDDTTTSDSTTTQGDDDDTIFDDDDDCGCRDDGQCKPFVRAIAAKENNGILISARDTNVPPDWRDPRDALACANRTFSDGPAVTNIQNYDSQSEPFIAVNPVNPDNMISVFHMGRASSTSGYLGVSYSFDGGHSWTQTLGNEDYCTGYVYNPDTDGHIGRSSDPWVIFDKFGTAYFQSLTGIHSDFKRGVMVSKSTDGGQTWTQPILTSAANETNADKNMLYADSFQAGRLFGSYHINFNDFTTFTGAVYVTRSTDFGNTWENKKVSDGFGGSSSVVVPNEDVVVVEFESQLFDNQNQVLRYYATRRSVDGGDTYGNLVLLNDFHEEFGIVEGFGNLFGPSGPNYMLRDVIGGVADMVTNTENGYVYMTIHVDKNLAGSSINQPAILFSKDEGVTWEDPVLVKPDDLEVRGSIYEIAVMDDGNIGVMFYDDRFHEEGNVFHNYDVWVRFFNADVTKYLGELRITDKSMNLLGFPFAPFIFNHGLFNGDYFGFESDRKGGLIAAHIQSYDTRTPTRNGDEELGGRVIISEPASFMQLFHQRAYWAGHSRRWIQGQNYNAWAITGEIVKDPINFGGSGNCGIWPTINVTGKILLVDSTSSSRSVCARNAGAIGVIGIDSDDYVTGETTGVAEIPTLRIAETTGFALSDAITNGTVYGTLTGDATGVIDATDRSDIVSVHVFDYANCLPKKKFNTVSVSRTVTLPNVASSTVLQSLHDEQVQYPHRNADPDPE